MIEQYHNHLFIHVSPTSLILDTYYGDFISRVRFRYKVISIILVSLIREEGAIFDMICVNNKNIQKQMCLDLSVYLYLKIYFRLLV